MFIKKIIILKSESGKNSGVLRLTANAGGLDGALTLNFAVSSPLTLVLDTGDVHEVQILDSENKFNLSSDGFDEAYCVVLDNGSEILRGSTDGDSGRIRDLTSRYFELKNAKRETAAAAKSDNKPQKSENKTVKSESKPNINEKQTSPKPKAAEKAAAQGAEPTAVINEGISYEGDNFYLAVKSQLDEMFECYPSEEKLTELVANSKWVRVDCDGEFYVVGVITDESGNAEYICYGIPGTYPVKPPEEISDVCEWFPLDLDNKFGDGYWLIYQNALTGKCLKNPDEKNS